MAYIHCVSGGGGAVEVVTGTETGTASGEFTVTSQQGKTPKRVQIWRDDGLCFSFWNDQRSAYALLSILSGTTGTAWLATGSAHAYCCNVKTVGADSVTFFFPSNASYATGKVFNYSVEFE